MNMNPNHIMLELKSLSFGSCDKRSQLMQYGGIEIFIIK